MSIIRTIAIAAALCLAATGFGAAWAATVSSLADGRSGHIEFESVTPGTALDYLRRLYAQPRTVVAGDLTLPGDRLGLPAVVIVHGPGGASQGREYAWAARLNAWGIATFVIDSFAPRGILQTATDQMALSTLAMSADALNALKLLSTHPRIDPRRIAVMGFAKGANVALNTALEPIRRAVIGSELRFAAHIAFYPACNIRPVAAQVDGSPILHLHGDQDDWSLYKPCMAWMDWFRGKGAAVEDKIYLGAGQGFDGDQPLRWHPDVQVSNDCRAELDMDNYVFRRLDTGEAFKDQNDAIAYFKGCRGVGAHFGADPQARDAAIADVRQFLTEVLDLQPGG
jgi:dienelactone hydrolase